MASATKGELVQLGADIRERVRLFCGAHGMQDHDGVPILLAACYYLAKSTKTLGDLGSFASFALTVWEAIDKAEQERGRPTLIVRPDQPRDVRVQR